MLLKPVAFLREADNPKDDSEKDVLNPSLRGFGFPLPNARMHNTEYPVQTQDISSRAVHALAEYWEHNSFLEILGRMSRLFFSKL